MAADLLGRAAQSSSEAAPRRAKGAGLDGEGADRAILHPPPKEPFGNTIGHRPAQSSPRCYFSGNGRGVAVRVRYPFLIIIPAALITDAPAFCAAIAASHLSCANA